MKIHVEEKVCREENGRRTGSDAAEASYLAAVDAAVGALLRKEWEVRESKTAFRIVPSDYPDSAGSLAEVRIREGRKDIARKVADAISMLPRVLRMLEESGLCISELLEALPYGKRVPPRTVAFVERMAAAAAAAAAEEGGAA